jgi:hypothetical protein
MKTNFNKYKLKKKVNDQAAKQATFNYFNTSNSNFNLGPKSAGGSNNTNEMTNSAYTNNMPSLAMSGGSNRSAEQRDLAAYKQVYDEELRKMRLELEDYYIVNNRLGIENMNLEGKLKDFITKFDFINFIKILRK